MKWFIVLLVCGWLTGIALAEDAIVAVEAAASGNMESDNDDVDVEDADDEASVEDDVSSEDDDASSKDSDDEKSDVE